MKDKFDVIKEHGKILVIILVVCIGYRLSFASMAVCMGAGVLFSVFYMREVKKSEINLSRYKDIVLYMEQMIYSFKKQPKIRPALEDAGKVSSEQMQEYIEEAIVNIDSKETENIYEESLGVIEDEYHCQRLRSLHKFLVKIENHGGEFEQYIDVLLEDIKGWNDRTLLFIKDVDRVKRNVLISIFSTLVTCGFMAYLIPKEYKYASHIVYQICSVMVIVGMLFSYIFVVKKLNFDWIKETSALPDNMVVKYYHIVEKGYEDKRYLKWSERLTYKQVKKRLENEISKTFPDWIRDVAINLQNDTVQSAIENSYTEAPFVIKHPIRKLLIDFEKYPVGIEPYNNLLNEFELQDIKSSVKMFYSINQLGKEQSQQQINSIIDRNNKLVAQAEDMKNKDRVGAAAMLSTLPMLIGVLKIMVDMMLMILVFTSSISSVISGG